MLARCDAAGGAEFAAEPTPAGGGCTSDQRIGTHHGPVSPTASTSATAVTQPSEARAHAFGALHQVAVAAGGVLDHIALASLAAEWARELLQIDGATVYWWDDNEGILECLTQKGPRASPPDQIIRMGEGLIGQTFLQREPIVVEDYQAWKHALPAAREGERDPRSAITLRHLLNMSSGHETVDNGGLEYATGSGLAYWAGVSSAGAGTSRAGSSTR